MGATLRLTGEEVAQLCYQVGFRGDEVLATMVAIAKRESGWNAYAWRSNNRANMTGDFGLFQINYIHDNANLRQVIGYKDRKDWLNPLINAKIALHLYNAAGFSPWNAAAGGYNANGTHLHNTNITAARQAVANAKAQGLLGKPLVKMGGDVGGIFSNAVGDIVDVVTSPLDVLSSLGSFFSMLLSAALWIRIAKVIGGIILIAVSLTVFIKKEGTT
jgi:hypothetical protein